MPIHCLLSHLLAFYLSLSLTLSISLLENLCSTVYTVSGITLKRFFHSINRKNVEVLNGTSFVICLEYKLSCHAFGKIQHQQFNMRISLRCVFVCFFLCVILCKSAAVVWLIVCVCVCLIHVRFISYSDIVLSQGTTRRAHTHIHTVIFESETFENLWTK